MAKKVMKKESACCCCDMKVYGFALFLLGLLKYFKLSWEFSLMITGAFLVLKSVIIKYRAK